MTGAPLTLQVISPSDRNKHIIWSLVQDYYKHVRGLGDANRVPTREEFETYWYSGGKLVYTLHSPHEKGKVAGILLLHVVQREEYQDSDVMELALVYVHPDFRGMCSLAWMRDSLRKVAEKADVPLFSEVAEGNTGVLRVLRRLRVPDVRKKPHGSGYIVRLI